MDNKTHSELINDKLSLLSKDDRREFERVRRLPFAELSEYFGVPIPEPLITVIDDESAV